MILKITRALAAQMSILHVAEKNSIAKQVANVLSRSSKNYIPGLSKYNPIYEFQLQDKSHRFTSVRGHLFDYQLPEQCKNWKAFDNKKILLSQVPMVKGLGPDMDDVVKNLNQLARTHTQLILWLDCDREGEAIAFQVIEICTKVNPRLKIKRARFSAVTPTDVWNAYNNLVNPNKLEADAVNYRIEIDFRSGCTFTRFQTTVFQRNFYSSNAIPISYGPCQMPTLNFVVQRYLEIKNFKPEKYWFIEMVCVIDENTGIPFSWQKKNTRSEVQANQALFNILSSFPEGDVTARVKDRKRAEKKKYRPYPLTTVKFQKLATDKLRLSSAKAMEIAEKLYQNGYISYPRTETNAFPKTMNLKNLLQRLNGSEQYGNYVKKLLQDNKFVAPKAGSSNDQAHTPIHPVKLAERNQLDPQSWKVYDLITRTFLACCSADAIGQQFSVKAETGGESFKASYLSIKQYNYLEIYPFEKWVETSFPAEIPQNFPALVTLKDSKTTPPGYMTQSELIDCMEKNQIGTDSTIHQHIQTIQKRQYVVKNNNTFKPTNLGASLVQTYKELQISLPECQIRRKIEQKMNRIAGGQISKDVATRQTLDQMLPIYDKLFNVKQEWLTTMKKYMESNSDLKKVEYEERTANQVEDQNKKVPILATSCSKCANDSRAVVRFAEHNQSYFLGCMNYPKCRWTHSVPSYIDKIKQLNKKCTKCGIGYLVEITPKQGKVIQPLMTRMLFESSESGSIEVCLQPTCDKDFYSYVTEYGYNSNFNSNTNTNATGYRNNYNSNNHRTNSGAENSNTQSKNKYIRSNTTTQLNKNKTNSSYDQSNRNQSSRKQIRCYRCNEIGHIAPKCPQKGGSINNKINEFKSGFPNIKKNQSRSNRTESVDEDNQEKKKKVCPECGAEGRHPRGTSCSMVRKKKPKQQ